MTEVRRIRADEWREWRALRLRALADAPDAFASTLVSAQRQTDGFWQSRVWDNARGETSIGFVAIKGAAWCGMASGHFEPGQRDVAEFVGLWVDPLHRRSGIARALLDAVTVWARERGATRLRLWVTTTNAPARALYERTGFLETGEATTLPSNSELREVRMSRELAPRIRGKDSRPRSG